MAKGGPEVGNTVPMIDNNGNITGYTTPEIAAELQGQEGITGANFGAPAAPSGGSSDPFSNPLQESGYHDDNENVTLFDPTTGEYTTHSVDPNDPFQYNPGGDLTSWGMVDGKRTLIDTSDPDWEQYGETVNAGDGNFDWVFGADQTPAYQPVIDNGINREDGGQNFDPDWTPPPPVETLRPGGGGSDDPFVPGGGGPDDGGAPPNTVRPDIPKPPDETEIKPWEPSDSTKGGATWNWDYFAPKQAGDGQWGGYDTDYGVFERYQPGQDSPWGMPDIEGGNQNFYQQQFNNLLRDEQGYRTRARAAQMRGQEAAENPAANPNYENMWASMGITPSEAAGGTADNPTYNRYTLQDWITPGETTNYDIMNRSVGANEGYPLNPDDPSWNAAGVNWGQASSPSELLGLIAGDADQNWRSMLEQGMNSAFINTQLQTPTGGGPTAAPGYALPTGIG